MPPAPLEAHSRDAFLRAVNDSILYHCRGVSAPTPGSLRRALKNDGMIGKSQQRQGVARCSLLTGGCCPPAHYLSMAMYDELAQPGRSAELRLDGTEFCMVTNSVDVSTLLLATDTPSSVLFGGLVDQRELPAGRSSVLFPGESTAVKLRGRLFMLTGPYDAPDWTLTLPRLAEHGQQDSQMDRGNLVLQRRLLCSTSNVAATAPIAPNLLILNLIWPEQAMLTSRACYAFDIGSTMTKLPLRVNLAALANKHHHPPVFQGKGTHLLKSMVIAEKRRYSVWQLRHSPLQGLLWTRVIRYPRKKAYYSWDELISKFDREATFPQILIYKSNQK